MLPSALCTAHFRKSIFTALPVLECLRSSAEFTSPWTLLSGTCSQSLAIVTSFDYASSYIRDIFCCSEITYCNKLV